MNYNEEEYNWGYDPLNYNVPEGSYSTNPYEGKVRIREFKARRFRILNGILADILKWLVAQQNALRRLQLIRGLISK